MTAPTRPERRIIKAAIREANERRDEAIRDVRYYEELVGIAILLDGDPRFDEAPLADAIEDRDYYTAKIAVLKARLRG